MNFEVFVQAILFGLAVAVLLLTIIALSLYITSSVVLGFTLISISILLGLVLSLFIGDNQ